MAELRHKRLGEAVDTTAPDGSEVRFLLRGDRGELNHFTLPPGATSAAVAHHAIEEIWYFLSGQGEMWRSDGASEETLAVGPGVCLDIPTGVRFQFRNTGLGAAHLPHRDDAAVARRRGGVRRRGQVAGGWDGSVRLVKAPNGKNLQSDVRDWRSLDPRIGTEPYGSTARRQYLAFP